MNALDWLFLLAEDILLALDLLCRWQNVTYAHMVLNPCNWV